ncbi:MAG: LarC family nickel insertion protein, partial [Actinomycetota bacterium]|nr:LarC family nickel insertion protein [Actinomycetota bacterium]
MTFAYFDCFAGVAGDMVLGALLDAGGSPDALRAGLSGLPVDPFELEVTQVERGGIGATHVRVRAERSHVIRTWAYLRGALGEADLPAPVRD